MNIDEAHSVLNERLAKTWNVAATLLSEATKVSVPGIRIPGSIFRLEFPDLGWTLKMLRQECTTWILANGFRDMQEATSLYLDHTFKLAELKRWAGTGPSRVIPSSEAAAYDRACQRFSEQGFPSKLEEIAKLLSITDRAWQVEPLLTLNKARNCLAHQGGRVGAGKPGKNGHLAVKWKSFLWIVEHGGQTREARLHELKMIPEGARVQLKTTPREKTFARGAVVSFTADEFVEIAYTYRSFGDHVHEKLGELLRRP